MLIFPGFVVATITVYVNFGIAGDLARWEMDRAEKLARREAKRGLAAEVRSLQAQRDRLAAEVARLGKQPQQAKATTTKGFGPQNLPKANRKRKLNQAQRQQQVLELHGQHSQAEIARMLQVSPSTIKRDIRELNGQLVKG